MHPFAALPIALAAFVVVGQPLVRRAVPGLPRDVEVACGLGLGASLVGSLAFVLSVAHAATPLAFAVALPALAAVAVALGGWPRLPRRRAGRFLAPVAWFGLAALSLMILQPVPQGGGWTFDWSFHFIADQRYADPAGIGNPELGFGWSIFSRPPLFNLARIPAELLVGQTYAAAEAATVALALVFPAGAWLLLREIARLDRARAALWLLPASGFWVHFGAYPKPTPFATGLFLACLGLVVRERRRPRRGLIPLAAALGVFSALAHPVCGLGLLLAGGSALARASWRERIASAAIVLGAALPWPLWASHVTHGHLAAHDPMRRYFGHGPLGAGLDAVNNAAWNVVASAYPVPLVAHVTALATGGAKLARDPFLEVLLEALVTQGMGALGFAWLAYVLATRRWPRTPLARPRTFAVYFLAAAALVAFGWARIVQVSGLHPPFHVHGPAANVLEDNRVILWFLPLTAAAFSAVALRLFRSAPAPGAARADLVLGTAVLEATCGMLLYSKAEYQGNAHAAVPPALAIGALWLWTEVARSSRVFAALFCLEGLGTLLFLGVGGALGVLPPDKQMDWKGVVGFTGLHDRLGALSLIGAPLLVVVVYRVFRAPELSPRSADGRSSTENS